jgi:hypothetical protein
MNRRDARNRTRLKGLIREAINDVMMVDPGVISLAHDATDGLPGRDLAYGEGDGRMLKNQLHRIAQDAQSLHDRLRDSDELPEWVKAKVSVMNSDIGRIRQYLDYKLMRGTKEDWDF